MTTSVPALHYRGITAGYGRTTVLRNVDLVAPAGMHEENHTLYLMLVDGRVHTLSEIENLAVSTAENRIVRVKDFADRAYFVGCSSGGHQALSEAQRYPEDYDGIIAGDPANNRIRQTFAFLHAWVSTHTADGKPIIPAGKLALMAGQASCLRRQALGVSDHFPRRDHRQGLHSHVDAHHALRQCGRAGRRSKVSTCA